jgi:hypothetical protein
VEEPKVSRQILRWALPAALLWPSVPASAQALRIDRKIEVKETTPDRVKSHLEELATKSQQQEFPKGARALSYVLTWPADVGDLARLGGHGVMLITAVTQTKTELPLKRVYVRRAGIDVPFEKIFAWSNIAAQDNQFEATYGKHREDSSYLVPLLPLLSSGVILVDWASTRTEYKVVELPLEAPQSPDANWDKLLEPRRPPHTVVKEFIQRNFPGYKLPAKY